MKHVENVPLERGWYQRDSAITYLRENSHEIFGSKKGVVYFADDDNSYDTRLFTDYISRVTKVGVWAVGALTRSRRQVISCRIVVNARSLESKNFAICKVELSEV